MLRMTQTVKSKILKELVRIVIILAIYWTFTLILRDPYESFSFPAFITVFVLAAGGFRVVRIIRRPRSL